MVDIYAINIEDALNNYNLVEEIKFLDYYGQKKHRDYHFKEDLYRSVIGEMMVRVLLCKKCNVKSHQLSFYKNKYGKPYLKDGDDLFFNVSHSKNWVCVVLSKQEVGIDIEEVSRNYINLSKSYFNNSEILYINSYENSSQMKKFFEIWTMKESYVKAKGKGLSIPLNSFEVKQDVVAPYLWYTYHMEMKYFFKVFHFQDNYVISVSAPMQLQHERINIINCIDLFRDFYSYVF